MVDIRQNTASSRTEKALGGAVTGAAGGGIGGALAGIIPGAIYGVLTGVFTGTGLLAAGIGAIIGVSTGFGWAGLGYGALIGGLGVPAGLGAITGMGIGGGIGAGVFGAKGALGGVRDANDEDQRFALRKQNSQLTLETAKSQARGEAAEYYTAAGYQTGFEEGKNFVVNQIIAAKQQQMMMAAQEGNEPGFVDKHCKGKKSENHVQASEQVATAIPGQQTV